MKTVTIRLSTINDVRDLVNLATRCDFDVDLKSGRYVVDGKSIMGIYCLDLAGDIELTAHTDDGAEFFAALDRFIVK